MTVVSVLIASLAFQGAQQKPPAMRQVEVKPAGLAVAVPKAWGLNPKDSNLTASVKVPIAGSKNLGRLDIGYVIDESKDVEGFLEATKNVLTNSGSNVERQWKVDIMGSPLALTRFSKDGATTVRGVLFREQKQKFVIAVSSVTAEFEKVEPTLLSTLETMREIKVVQPKQPVVAVERKIAITKESPGKAKKLPISANVSVGGKNLVIHLPAGSVVTKLGDTSISTTVPGTTGSVVLSAYLSEGAAPSLTYQQKAAESGKLFKGAIQRIDQTITNSPDLQIRDFIWRTGLSEKASSPLMTADCVITQARSPYLHAFYSSSTKASFAKERLVLTKFLTTVNITEAQ
jgi:hypothetical protein